MASKSKKRNWKSGPPPHAGWWNASVSRDSESWRWWNAAGYWSSAAFSYMSPERAATFAPHPAASHHVKFIQWNDYWPEGARVPRVDPRK